MTDANITLGIDGQPAESGARTINRSLDDIVRTANRTAREVDNVDDSFDRLKGTVDRAKSALLGLGAAFGTREIINYSDTFRELESRLRTVTESTGQLANAQDRLFSIAQNRRQGFESIVTLYQRAGFAAQELNATQDDLIRFTDNVAKALAIQGGSAQQASGALLQLGQALGAGVVRAEEFNSLLEGALPVAQAAARGIERVGGSVAQLRAEIIDGNVTSREFFEALLSQGDELEKQFSNISLTVGQSLTQLDNAFLQFIGTSNTIAQGTNSLALGISFLAENFDLVAKAAIAGAIAFAGRLVPGILSYITASATATARTIAMNVALGQMAFSSRAAGTAVGLLRGITLSFAAALKAVPFALAVIGLTQIITGTGAAERQQNLLNQSMADFRTKVVEMNSASEDRKRQLINDSREIIAAHVAELESLNKLISSYAQINQGNFLERNLGALGLAGREVFGRLGIGQAPSEVFEQADQLRSTIREMQELLNNPSSVGGGAAVGSATPAIVATTQSATASVERLSEEQKSLARVFEETRTPAERYKMELEELQRLRPFAKTPEELEAINRAIQSLQAETTATGQIFNDFASDISGQFTDVFQRLFDGGINGLSDFASSFSDIFKRMLARLATQAIAEPIIVPIVSAAGSALGVDQGGIQGIVGQLGGSGGGGLGGIGGISDLSSVFSAVSGGLNTPIFSAGSTIGGAIDSVGSFFGLSGPVAQGPTLSGAAGYNLGVSANFTPGAGLASLGGNFLAGSLFEGGRYSDIGGTVGGVIGTAVGGPIGGFIGSFAGNALGGLFGPGESDKTASGRINLASGELDLRTLEGDRFSQENNNTRDLVVGFASTLSNLITEETGRQIQGELDIVVGSRDGLRFGFAGEGLQRVGSVEELLGGITTSFIDLAGEAGAASPVLNNLNTALKNISFENQDQALADLQFTLQFERLAETIVGTGQRTTEFEARVQNLRADFDSMRETTERLGLSMQTLEKNIAQVESTLRREFNDSVTNQILEATNSPLLGIIQEAQRYGDQLREAQAIGGDIQQVEVLHQIRMQQLINQTNGSQLEGLREQSRSASQLVRSYEGVARTLRNAINGILVNQFSTLSPAQRLAEAQSQFDTAFSAALGGDADAAGRLPGLANTLLGQGQSFFASSDDFARLQSDTVSKLEQVEAQALTQVDVQTKILESSNQQIEVLERGFANLEEKLALSESVTQQLLKARGDTINADGTITSADRGTFTAGNFNEQVVGLFGRGLVGASDALREQILSIFEETAPGITAGGGNFSRFFAANSSANSAAIALAQQLGIPGFAMGGTFSGTGIVGERGPEFITTSQNAMVIPFQQNRLVVDTISRSNEHLEAVVRVMQSGFSGIFERLDKLTATVSEESKRARRNVSGKRKAA